MAVRGVVPVADIVQVYFRPEDGGDTERTTTAVPARHDKRCVVTVRV